MAFTDQSLILFILFSLPQVDKMCALAISFSAVPYNDCLCMHTKAVTFLSHVLLNFNDAQLYTLAVALPCMFVTYCTLMVKWCFKCYNSILNFNVGK